MNKEEYIIKINDNEISVSKELYNILVPLGKIINKLQQENQQLKDNWNKLKNIAKSQSDIKQKLGNDRLYFEIDEILLKIEELEKGDSNE